MRTALKRLVHTAVLVVAGASVLGAPAPAVGADALALKWTKGQTLKYRISTQTATMQVMGRNEQKSKMSAVMDLALEVKDVGSDGAATMEAKYIAVKGEVEDTAGTKRAYDSSKKPGEPGNDPEFARTMQMLDKPFSVVMEPSGKVRDLKGLSEIVGAPPGSEEGLRLAFEQTFFVLPEKPAAVGDTWSRGATMGLVRSEAVYTYRGTADKVATLDMDVKFTLPEAEMQGMRYELQPGSKGVGVVAFDTEAGQIKHAEATVNLGVKVIGMQGEGAQSQEMKMSLDRLQ